MPRNTNTTTATEPPVDRIETITVSIDDISEALRYNNRQDPHDDGRKVIRIRAPFTAENEASIHYHDGTRYPDDTNPKLIHISPSRFIEDGVECPNRLDARARARDELDDPSEEDIAEYVQNAYDFWEYDVRSRRADELQSNPHSRTSRLDGIAINWRSE